MVEELCPWFPSEGTVNLEAWRRVGLEFKNQIYVRGASALPPGTMNLWGQLREALDPHHKIELMSLKSSAFAEDPLEEPLPEAPEVPSSFRCWIYPRRLPYHLHPHPLRFPACTP